jgi:adenine-specific DNA-methyltransferase
MQIGDENVHVVRCVMDEVFGSSNFVSLVTLKKTSGASSELLAGVTDYLLWYAKSREYLKYRQLYFEKSVGGLGGEQYAFIEDPDGERQRMKAPVTEATAMPNGSRVFRYDNLTSQRPPGDFPITMNGETYRPGKGYWKTGEPGMQKLAWAGRLAPVGKTLSYVRYIDDFPVFPVTNLWDDTVTSGFADKKVYVVQTSPVILHRCLLMSTDPGDLVLDPTCGSGTTAYVAEQWGRRWITIDTSRVALALARTRLMAAQYPYYLLADSREGIDKEAEVTGKLPPPHKTEGDIRKGFVYKRVPHVTLKSIANNPDIKEGMSREAIDRAIARHADQETLYDQPYEKLKRALRAEINEEAWAALYRTESLPFTKPETGKIAVKVINHYGDEVLKVFEV